MKPPHGAPPCKGLPGPEASLQSLPYSLALLKRQEPEVKEPSYLLKMDLEEP